MDTSFVSFCRMTRKNEGDVVEIRPRIFGWRVELRSDRWKLVDTPCF